jgi:type I restriction enzyme M protein
VGVFRDRRGQTLFIDARKLGTMIDRVHRELTEEDIRKIADTYHAWRGDRTSPSPSGRGRGEGAKNADIPGFCKSATLDDIRHHGHILTPGRYVGAAEVEDDGEPFEQKMARLTAELREQTKQAARLDKLIWANLKDIGYGG